MEKILRSSLIAVIAAGLGILGSSFVGTNSARVEDADSTSSDAAETFDHFIIYAKEPEGVDSINLWAWNNASGENAFDTLPWPGRTMKADPNNDGWYYLYVPSKVDIIILNNGADLQTDGITIESKDVWLDNITANEVENEDGTTKQVWSADVSYDQLTEGDLPAFIPDHLAYAYIPNDWDKAIVVGTSSTDTEDEFTATMDLQSDGWFSLFVPSEYDRITINNGETGDKLKVSETVGVEDKVFYVMVDDEKDDDGLYKAIAYYEKPVIASETFTVHAYVPDTWTDPHIWAWSDPDGTNAFTAWPGEAMTSSDDGFVLDVPTFVNSIIINNGKTDDTAEQTSDVKGIEPNECWIVVGEKDANGAYQATAQYEKPNEGTGDNTSSGGSDSTGDGDTDQTPEEDQGLSIGAMVGIVIGSVAGLALITWLVWYLIDKKNKNKRVDSNK